MNHPSLGQFALLLPQECDVVARFLALLKEEHEALRTGDVELLASFVDKKAMMSAELNQFSEKRGAYLKSQGLSPDREGMKAWCQKHAAEKEIVGLWDKIVTLAKEARDYNLTNGEMIELRMRHNEQAIHILRQGHQTLGLYGPDGRSSHYEGVRIMDRA